MDILRKTWDGIEYYLIDKYETEFSFGVVYHFISDNDEKFCFYKDNTYIPIKNKLYLRKIANELKVNGDILFRNNSLSKIGNIKRKPISSNKERWDLEKEFKEYNKVSNIIHELFPDIPYKDIMGVLDDDSGIYSALLSDADGRYFFLTSEIHLNKSVRKFEYKERVILHEMIHKLTNRNGFFINNKKHFIGLVEGATEKICEDKYGDKTSHTIYLDNTEVLINFSRESSYQFPQILYRQMAQLVEPGMADKSIINGDKSFFDKFSDLYGKDLFVYLNHRANRLLKDSLPEKKQLKYLREAQSMLLTKAFDKKFSSLQTEEDIINYMSELRDFECVTAKIEDDTTFQDYYNNKYNSIIQLAQQKGLDASKLEQYQYFEVDFYPERNDEKSRPFEIRNIHISNLLELENFDLSKYMRLQVDPCPNFFGLDIVLENGIPISVVCDQYSSPINHIEHDNEYFDIIKENFDIEDEEIDIYNIASDTHMIIKADESSVICSESSKTGKIYYPSQHEIDLDIAPHHIEERYNKIQKEAETTSSDTHYYEATPVDLINLENTKGRIAYLFDNFKKFFKSVFTKQNLKLPAPTTNLPNTASKNKHLTFTNQLNPDNENYNHSTIIPVEKSEHSTEKATNFEEEIDK